MKNKLMVIAETALLFIITAALLLTESVTFAWLSTTWRSGTFTLKNSQLYTSDIEVWRCIQTVKDNKVIRSWEDISQTTDGVTDAVYVTQINSSTDANTFTKSGELALYFGTVNNLAQETDNLPVYIKATLKVPGNSSNKIIISCELPDTYLDIYKVTTTNNVTSGAKQSGDVVTELNTKTKYDFLKLDIYFGEKYTDNTITKGTTSYIKYTDSSNNLINIAPAAVYSLNTENKITDGETDVGESFEAIFEDSGKVVRYSIGGTKPSIECVNSNSNEAEFTFYFKFSVDPSTLRQALEVDAFRMLMPVYLIFNTKFNILVETSALK